MILKTFLSTISSGVHFLIKQKLCKHFLQSRKWYIEKTRQLFKILFTIWFIVVPEKHFVKSRIARKFDLTFSIEIIISINYYKCVTKYLNK